MTWRIEYVLIYSSNLIGGLSRFQKEIDESFFQLSDNRLFMTVDRKAFQQSPSQSISCRQGFDFLQMCSVNLHRLDFSFDVRMRLIDVLPSGVTWIINSIADSSELGLIPWIFVVAQKKIKKLKMRSYNTEWSVSFHNSHFRGRLLPNEYLNKSFELFQLTIH